MQSLGTLEDVPVKIGDFWVSEDFINADMIETDDTQIIIDMPFLVSVGCIIDVKEERKTCKVGGIMLHFVLRMRKLFPLILP